MKNQDAASREFWDRVGRAPGPGDLPGLLDKDARMARFRHAAELTVLRERFPELATKQRVLEVGCGGGRWTAELAPGTARYVATDIAPAMIDRAQERLQAAGVRHVELHVCPFHEMPFEGPFDLVYLGSCLHYIDDEHIDLGLRQLQRVCGPDAVILTRDTVSLIGRTFHRSERYGGDDPAIYRPVAAYQEMFARYGWQLDDQWRTYVEPPAWRLRTLLPPWLLQRLLDRAIAGQPAAVERAKRRPLRGDKAHCFFTYRR